MMKDDRIPLRFAAAADVGAGEAVLLEDGAGVVSAAVVARFRAAAMHVPGCACCVGRGAAAAALGGLFQDRARGRVAWFSAVVAVVRDPGRVAAELAADVVVAARFRFEGAAEANTTE